jgi:predicted TIM-barrel fold metal-dependent hydrolase
MKILAEPKIDCHCHVIDPVRFPYRDDTRYRPAGQEIAPVEHFLRMMDLYGVRQALIVGTNSGYAEDLSPVLDALARHPSRFKGVAVVANDIGLADLARLRASGMAGVAFNAPYHGTEHYAGSGDLLRKLRELDMFLNLQVKDDQLLELLPLIERSEVRLVVDHCGRPTPSRGLDQPGFKALLALGRAGRASIKLSGFSQFSAERYPYRDAQPFIAALLDAFTPDRCVWGSDWPFLRATERIDYGPLLLLAEALVPDETSRRKILWDTPGRLFGFAA